MISNQACHPQVAASQGAPICQAPGMPSCVLTQYMVKGVDWHATRMLYRRMCWHLDSKCVSGNCGHMQPSRHNADALELSA